MKILILGATGYLGGNIAVELKKKGYDVWCIRREKSNIDFLINHGIRNFIDIADSNSILTLEHFDWVINCACTYKSNDNLYRDMINSNLSVPLCLFNDAINHGVKNYISIDTCLPRFFNMYSFTKYQFAQTCKYYSSLYPNLNIGIIRLEMFYGGENEPNNRFIKNSIYKLIHNYDIDLTMGIQKRDLIRIEDVSALITLLINSGYLCGYRELDVGTGESYSIREILSYMKNCLNSNSNLKFGAIGARVNEPDTVADIEWYKDIGYKLKYHFFEGLDDLCEAAKQGRYLL